MNKHGASAKMMQDFTGFTSPVNAKWDGFALVIMSCVHPRSMCQNIMNVWKSMYLVTHVSFVHEGIIQYYPLLVFVFVVLFCSY